VLAGRVVTEEDFMGLILWLVIGGVIGWLASIIMRTDAQQGILMNIVGRYRGRIHRRPHFFRRHDQSGHLVE
jgi:hypothetical protein